AWPKLLPLQHAISTWKKVLVTGRRLLLGARRDEVAAPYQPSYRLSLCQKIEREFLHGKVVAECCSQRPFGRCCPADRHRCVARRGIRIGYGDARGCDRDVAKDFRRLDGFVCRAG